MHSFLLSARRRSAGALGALRLASTLLPLGVLAACAAKNPDASEIPKPPPAYRSDRAEDRVDEECPDCLGPGDATIRQEEEE